MAAAIFNALDRVTLDCLKKANAGWRDEDLKLWLPMIKKHAEALWLRLAEASEKEAS